MVVDPRQELDIHISPYTYVANNPIRSIDFNGECDLSNPDCRAFVAGAGRGAWESLKSTASGLWNAVTDPVGTASGIVHAVTNPGETLAALGDAVVERGEKVLSGDPGQAGEVLGEAVVIVAEILVGTKGAGAAAKGARVARATDTAADVATTVSSPGGRLGGVAHRTAVRERANALIAERQTITAGGGLRPERAVYTPEGRRRFPDISTIGPNGQPYFENVGRANQSGRPIARERRALDDIRRATQTIPGFTPYNR